MWNISIDANWSISWCSCCDIYSKLINILTTYLGAEAFKNCTNLKSVVIENGLTSIDNRTFENCSSLSYIKIPTSIKSIGFFALYNCDSLSSINYDGTVAEWNSIKKEYNDYKAIICSDGNKSS